jgi:dTDP-4-dehydrorhamnose 3,5-epimerase
MEIQPLAIPGLLAIAPRRLGDARGYFAEIWRQDLFEAAAGPVTFVQENQSFSARAGTVRGLHFQRAPHAQGKLVRCVAGAIFDVAVDLRHGSPSFGQWAGMTLSAQGLNQIWLPPGFAHGFCTLRPDTVVAYRVTAPYSPLHDDGLAWNDPAIGIAWPAQACADTLSPRDRTHPRLADLTPRATVEEAARCA